MLHTHSFCITNNRIFKCPLLAHSGHSRVDCLSLSIAQCSFFDVRIPKPNSEALMSIMDTLHMKEGKGTLYFAGQGITQSSQMKREMLSPCYTTRLTDVPVARAN